MKERKIYDKYNYVRNMCDSLAYCCSEAATIMLTKVSALELAKYNIKVNTVSPSLTLTPLSRKKLYGRGN